MYGDYDLMIEKTITCDRCGKEIKNNTYFTIDIYGHNADESDNRLSTSAASENTSTNLIKIFGCERHYCEKCKEEIKRFCMGNDELKAYLKKEKERVEQENKCRSCKHFIACSLGLMQGHKCPN